MDKAIAVLQVWIDVCWPNEEPVRLAKELGYELDENDHLISEEEKLASMTPSELAEYYLDMEELGEFLFADNITFFGQDVYEITMDEVLSLAVENRLDDYPEHLRLWTASVVEPHVNVVDHSSGPGYGESLIRAYRNVNSERTNFDFLQMGCVFVDNQEVRERFASGISIGILDLCTGDSLETALVKMGLENAEQIAAAILRMDLESDYVAVRWGHPREELENIPVGAKCYDRATFQMVEHDSSEEQRLRVRISPYYRTDGFEAGTSSLELWFTEPDFCLWGFEIHN